MAKGSGTAGAIGGLLGGVGGLLGGAFGNKKDLMGGMKNEGNISNLTPEQQQMFNQLLGMLGPQAGNILSQFGQAPEDAFQKYYAEPAQQAFSEYTAPGIQQRFVDANAGASSALNQALSKGASDVATNIGSQYGQFQQQYGSQQLDAVRQILGLVTGQTFTPMVSQSQGLLGPLIQGAATLGGAYLGSSKKIKKNIRLYDKGINVLEDMKVNQYEYIEQLGGDKGIGLIAEDLPEDLTKEINGILHVDLYALMGLMINSIKDLSEKVKTLESELCLNR